MTCAVPIRSTRLDTEFSYQNVEIRGVRRETSGTDLLAVRRERTAHRTPSTSDARRSIDAISEYRNEITTLLPTVLIPRTA